MCLILLTWYHLGIVLSYFLSWMNSIWANGDLGKVVFMMIVQVNGLKMIRLIKNFFTFIVLGKERYRRMFKDTWLTKTPQQVTIHKNHKTRLFRLTFSWLTMYPNPCGATFSVKSLRVFITSFVFDTKRVQRLAIIYYWNH